MYLASALILKLNFTGLSLFCNYLYPYLTPDHEPLSYSLFHPSSPRKTHMHNFHILCAMHVI